MVSATRVPNTQADFEVHWVPRIASRLGSIDHTICSVSSKLRSQRLARCRFALNVSGLDHRRGHGGVGPISLAADHQLPGDTRGLVGQRDSDELGWLAP